MSTIKTVALVFVDNSCTEVGAAAFFSTKPYVEMCPTTQKFALEHNSLDAFIADGIQHVVVLGTYWPHLAEIAAGHRSIEFHQYHPGTTPLAIVVPTTGNLHIVHANGVLGPVAGVAKIFENIGLLTDDVRSEMRGHAYTIRMIDNRALNIDVVETQIFFGGLDNYDQLDQSLTRVHRLRKIFLRDIPDIQPIVECGRGVYNCQLGLVRAQADTTRMFEHEGIFYYVYGGTVLTVLTHSEMENRIPEEQRQKAVRVMVQPMPANENFNFSFRSAKDGPDVAALATKLYPNVAPGASSTACAAKIPVNFLEFLKIIPAPGADQK